MGGGKTHNLLALGLLARHPELRAQVMGGFYRPADIGPVRVVAFSGRESDVPLGVWGAIAEQLGKRSQFSDYYSPLSAPGQTAWVNLLRGEPLVIMLDELSPYLVDAASKSVGNSDLSVVTATALANLLVAVGRDELRNVCLVLSDLTASYAAGGERLAGVLRDLEKETGRTAMNLEPVRMNTDEFYQILRTRLFETLPGDTEIDEVAQGYAKAVREAKQMDVTNASPEQFASRVVESYPFHPAIRDLYARFRENQGFQQTRGLIRLMRIVVSRIWNSDRDPYLVAAHDLDLADRETLTEINQVNPTLENAVAHDVAAGGAAVAEVIDTNLGGGTDAQDTMRLLLVASLANVPGAVKGLAVPEIVANLCAPGRDVSRLQNQVIARLVTAAWYLHTTSDGRLHVRNVQNLVARVTTTAGAYLREQAASELKSRLREIFEPTDGWCYQQVAALPAVDDVNIGADKVTLVVSEPHPDGLHPDLVKLYEQLTYRNRVCFLTGERAFDSLLERARELRAINQIIAEMHQEGVADSDPRRDRDVFLALLTMDEEGLWRRKRRAIPLKEVWRLLSQDERVEWFAPDTGSDRPRLRKGRTAGRERLQRLAFDRLTYDEKLAWCDRPEQVDGPSEEAWKVINGHLGTTAASLPELVREFGERRFGRAPRVGDAFCGGGSVPFEAARLGCEAFGSDLNPVAALLTWGALNIVGGGEEVAERVRTAQAAVFDAVDRQITEWRIEHDDAGWRADAFLYCMETACPACGWRVPLAPSWVIGEKSRTIARLHPDRKRRCFAIDIRSGVEPEELAAAKAAGTVENSRLRCPNPDCEADTPLTAIRGDRRGDGGRGYGLRSWENDDLVPRPDDVLQERLYCVRWRPPRLDALLEAEQHARASLPFARPVPDWVDLDAAIASLIEAFGAADRRAIAALRRRDWLTEDCALEEARRELEALRASGRPKADREEAAQRLREAKETIKRRNGWVEVLAKSIPTALYRAVEADDLEREARTFVLLRERFPEWQARGYVPSRPITPGAKTDEPIRTRGWTHWHHLFTPRQLLMHGELAEVSATSGLSNDEMVACLLGIGRAVDWNSRLLPLASTRSKRKERAGIQQSSTEYPRQLRRKVARQPVHCLDASIWSGAGG